MKIENIKKVAVLGAGTMGPGIAGAYASGGYEVNIYARPEAVGEKEKAQEMLKTNLKTLTEKECLTREEAEGILERITFYDSIEETVRGCQYVQETVAERPQIKKNVFELLDQILPEDTIIVTNTSSLNPFELIPESRKSCFATAHWFAPPHIIPLVEVAKGERTAESTMEIVMSVLKKCKKSPVRLEKFVPGYIINRLQILLNTEIFYLLDEGICTPEMLDKAVKSSLLPRGLVLGLVQRYDFTGLDISANNITNASYVMPPTSKHPECLFSKVERGDLGVKTGKGFYDYGGRSVQELCKIRDERLIDVLKAAGDLIDKQI